MFKNKWLTYLMVSLISIVYGFSVRTFKIFPYELLLKLSIVLEYDKKYVENFEDDFDADKLIKVAGIANTDSLRLVIKSIIGIDSGRTEVSSVIDIVQNEPWVNDNLPSNVEAIKFQIEMPYGVQSNAILLIPEFRKTKTVVYHQGHGQSYIDNTEILKSFLEDSFAVFCFDMPLEGNNNQPIIFDDNLGDWQLTEHNQLSLLESDSFCTLQFFVDPVLHAMDWLEENNFSEEYAMTGISGGGWTTYLCAALDTRIRYSYPVAGGLPLQLRFEWDRNIGDYEQIHPKLFTKVNYMDLFVLGSTGKNRRQIQYFNFYDPCCFSGNVALSYKPAIKNLLESDFDYGFFDVIIDSSQVEHDYSKQTIEHIINDLNQQ